MSGESDDRSADLARVEDLFHRALDLEPRERATFLESECGGDARLRDEVLSLLESDTRTGGPLLPPGVATMASAIRSSTLGPAPGARVGAFVLRERIGAGAMGTVWRGERADDTYAQEVAVKLLPPGLESDETIARFSRERAMLARLEHPGIARLIDGGATEAGVPYLVMEYVDGLPIDRFCEERRLSVEERLELFTEVCDAVQAAHRSLVVHRDLKPANILVDKSGRARLLDFGIAKLLDKNESGCEAGLTFAGERLMTPRYASPEQVRGEPVTTATDVYSLGVLLYELLAGRLPYRTATETVRELESAILDQDPERPSAAARREGGPADLSRRLAGDIDTIVLRAMRKEPEGRYPSAESLAEDVRRHLKGLPVLARKDTLGYRTSKFVKRHRLAVAVASAGAVLALASAVAIVRSARLAAERLTDVLRLSDLSRLSEYTAAAEGLFPALPEKAPALEAWLAAARDLSKTLPGHRLSLEALRARSLPYDDAAREADERADPKAGRLDDLLVQRESTRARLEREPEREADLRPKLAEIDAEIAAIGSRAAPPRRTWRFASVEEEWQHAKLAELVAGLEAFSAAETGLVARVESRLERARTIRAESIDSRRSEWDAAIASIRDPFECPAYGGLVLVPQLGLVPLGRDPASGLHEFAHVATGAIPARGPDGALAIGEETGLVFVLVPGGRFRMGSDAASGDPAARPDEAPRHEVALAPFFLSKYEMTQGQWLRFTGSNPSVYRAGQKHGSVMLDLRHPVDSVTWEESDRTLARLRLALPTEAQWEYAARAGTETAWWTGADRESLRGAANLADAAAARNGAAWQTVRDWPGYDDGHVVHAPVDAFRANPWGFANVAGNLWEWCADDYAGYDVPLDASTGRRLWQGTPIRVGRGGSFMEAAVSLRSAHRGNGPTNVRQTTIGLRPALAIRNEPEPR